VAIPNRSELSATILKATSLHMLFEALLLGESLEILVGANSVAIDTPKRTYSAQAWVILTKGKASIPLTLVVDVGYWNFHTHVKIRVETEDSFWRRVILEKIKNALISSKEPPNEILGDTNNGDTLTIIW